MYVYTHSCILHNVMYRLDAQEVLTRQMATGILVQVTRTRVALIALISKEIIKDIERTYKHNFEFELVC